MCLLSEDEIRRIRNNRTIISSADWNTYSQSKSLSQLFISEFINNLNCELILLYQDSIDEDFILSIGSNINFEWDRYNFQEKLEAGLITQDRCDMLNSIRDRYIGG